jgi:hypothetical protein
MRIKEITTEDVEFIPQLPPKFGNINYKERGGDIITTTPKKYLAACPRLDVDVGSQNKIDHLKMKIKAGDPIDPPALFLKNGQVIRHDGRHRAVAALQLGIEHIPAILIPLEGELTKDVGAQKTGKSVQL